MAVCQSKSRIENDNQAEQGQFTFNDIHRYLHDGRYPDGYADEMRRHLEQCFEDEKLTPFPPQRSLLRKVGRSMHSFMFTAYVDSLKVMTLT